MSHKDFSILFVDDEAQNLVSFKASYRRMYDVHTAESGEEGIEVLRNNDVDLVITDQRMPGMTGVEFLKTIIPEFPDTVRIVLTGFSDIEAIVGAINEGQVFRYITKPWDERELQMTLENARELSGLQKSRKDLVKELKKKVEEQERILKLFMKYVPQVVVEQALDSSEESIFQGSLHEVAVLFCDLRGFTSFSERLSPREVVTFLNDYYALMTEVILQHGGSVNQFVGDEIFAAFGAPEDMANKEQAAVFCAMVMVEQLEILNQKYRERFGSDVQLGIGINYGEVVAGNLGSTERIDYSLTGDTVNTGKRIETLSKDTPNSIFVSESVMLATQDLIDTEALDPVFVRGKEEPLQVYNVLGKK